MPRPVSLLIPLLLSVSPLDAHGDPTPPGAIARLGPVSAERDPLTSLTFSPDGKTLATAGRDRRIHLWNIAEGKKRLSLEHPGAVTALAFTPDGKRLVTAGGDGSETAVRLWDTATGKQGKQLRVRGTPEQGWAVTALAFSANGKTILAETGIGLQVWDAATATEVDRRGEEAEHTARVARSEAGPCRVALLAEGWERLGLLRSNGDAISFGMRFPITHRLMLTDAAADVPLARIAAGRYDHVENPLWPVGEVRASPLNHLRMFGVWSSLRQGPLTAFSPDGRLLLSRTAGEVRVHELATGEPAWSARLGDTLSGSFTTDGMSVVVTVADGAYWLLDARTGKQRGGRAALTVPLTNAISPDARRLATGEADGTVLVWDVEALARPRESPKAVDSKEFAALWTDIGAEEPPTAFRALERLRASPGTVAFLRDRLGRETPREEKRLAGLVRDLDSRQVAVREKAMEELKRLGSPARPALAVALADRPSLEARRRIEVILGATEVPERLIPVGEPLRRYRAIQALEEIGTAEAREVLRALAEGTSQAMTTMQARAALERLK